MYQVGNLFHRRFAAVKQHQLHCVHMAFVKTRDREVRAAERPQRFESRVRTVGFAAPAFAAKRLRQAGAQPTLLGQHGDLPVE